MNGIDMVIRVIHDNGVVSEKYQCVSWILRRDTIGSDMNRTNTVKLGKPCHLKTVSMQHAVGLEASIGLEP
jgi:hypothetical protein